MFRFRAITFCSGVEKSFFSWGRTKNFPFLNLCPHLNTSAGCLTVSSGTENYQMLVFTHSTLTRQPGLSFTFLCKPLWTSSSLFLSVFFWLISDLFTEFYDLYLTCSVYTFLIWLDKFKNTIQNPLWQKSNNVLETFLRDFVHTDIIVSHGCCRFVTYTSMMQTSSFSKITLSHQDLVTVEATWIQ